MNYYFCTECYSVFMSLLKKKNLKHCTRRLIKIDKKQYTYYKEKNA